MTKFYYFPVAEFILFALALVLLGVGFLMGLNPWLSVIMVFFSYGFTMASSCIIKLEKEKLTIIPLSPLQVKKRISMGSITKINSQQSYTFESDLTAEATYPFFRRDYSIEYLDEKNKQKAVSFSISNKAKEKALMTLMQKCITKAYR